MSTRCVILTGMMGAGKSEVGEQLADQLGYEVVDTDKLVEKMAGKSIAKNFEQDGEEAFRALEREAIGGLKGSRSRVIAVGGGGIVEPENRKVLYALGQVVYLKASASELYARVKNDKTRPLLQKENPRGVLKELLEARRDAYEAADITIDTEDLSVDEVVNRMIDEMARRTVETQPDE